MERLSHRDIKQSKLETKLKLNEVKRQAKAHALEKTIEALGSEIEKSTGHTILPDSEEDKHLTRLKEEVQFLSNEGYLKTGDENIEYNRKITKIKYYFMPEGRHPIRRDGEELTEYAQGEHYSLAIMTPGGYEALMKIAEGHEEIIDNDYSHNVLKEIQKHAQKNKDYFQDCIDGKIALDSGFTVENAKKECEKYDKIIEITNMGFKYHTEEITGGLGTMSEILCQLAVAKIERIQDIILDRQQLIPEGSQPDIILEQAKVEVVNLSLAGCLPLDKELAANLAVLKRIHQPGKYSIEGCEKGGELYVLAESESKYQNELNNAQNLSEPIDTEYSHSWLKEVTSNAEASQLTQSEIQEVAITGTNELFEFNISQLKKYVHNMDSRHLISIDYLRSAAFKARSMKDAKNVPILSELQQAWNALYQTTNELTLVFGLDDLDQTAEKLGVTIYLVDQLERKLEESVNQVKAYYTQKYTKEYEKKYAVGTYEDVIEIDAQKASDSYQSKEKEGLKTIKDLLDGTMLNINVHIHENMRDLVSKCIDVWKDGKVYDNNFDGTLKCTIQNLLLTNSDYEKFCSYLREKLPPTSGYLHTISFIESRVKQLSQTDHREVPENEQDSTNPIDVVGPLDPLAENSTDLPLHPIPTVTENDGSDLAHRARQFFDSLTGQEQLTYVNTLLTEKNLDSSTQSFLRSLHTSAFIKHHSTGMTQSSQYIDVNNNLWETATQSIPNNSRIKTIIEELASQNTQMEQ